MKAKLIKTDDGYHLKALIKDVPKGINVYNKINDKECYFGFGTHSGKLSIKNCEAIELGYDLDELAYEKSWNEDSEKGFINGAKAILEILGDKKFSEGDMMLSWDAGVMSQAICTSNYFGLKRQEQLKEHRDYYKENLKHVSLKQTKWDVEVVMDRIPADLAPGGWDVFPKLDKEGCLILRRID